MIITRTPFRVSFAGGGTDLRAFYGKNGYGAVVSAAIQKYMYIVIHPYFHDKIRIKYSKTENVDNISEIKHPIVRECLKKVGIDRGVEIASFADVASGTGLGSSSSFTVGLLHALYAYKGKKTSKEKLAAEACEIEIDILKEPIGKQDQYAASYGGLNHIRFNSDETVTLTPLPLAEEALQELQKTMRLYYTGAQRKSKDILSEQQDNLGFDEKTFANHQEILGHAEQLLNMFSASKINEVGELLHESWFVKRQLADGISNGGIDRLYDRACQHGASGGKLLGAGKAGFLLLQHQDHAQLQRQLERRVLPLEIDCEGTKILFDG